MRDLQFSGNNWDASQDKNDIVFVLDAAEVSQNSAIRLQFILGEQFDDTRVGVPWLTDMVSPAVGMDAKREIIRRTILNTYGVKSLEKLTLDVDANGNGTIQFEGTTENNEYFSGTVNA
jgi:hypothetical protein